VSDVLVVEKMPLTPGKAQCPKADCMDQTHALHPTYTPTAQNAWWWDDSRAVPSCAECPASRTTTQLQSL